LSLAVTPPLGRFPFDDFADCRTGKVGAFVASAHDEGKYFDAVD
jgi:hypothetical protein